MSAVDFFLQRFEKYRAQPALIWQDRIYSYQNLLDDIARIEKLLPVEKTIVALDTEDRPLDYAALFALLKRHIAVPMLASLSDVQKSERQEISRAQAVLHVGADGEVQWHSLASTADHPLYQKLQSGLVLFSSGTAREPKGIVHDFNRLAERFKKVGSSQRLLQSLLFDHIGGLNTAFSVLSGGGSLVLEAKKDPTSLMRAMIRHQVEILPTSPSFLRWWLLSGELDHTKLHSLKKITYGTEPMSASTLEALQKRLPHVRFKQTYGLSETGIFSTQSRADDSLWMRLRESFRIKNGLLEIQAPAGMLGYLNAESPWTPDGWFQTFDAVETDGEWIRVLGRQSEWINVGGNKVSPTEVENVLLAMPNVLDATVTKAANPLLGEIVQAQIHLREAETESEFRIRMRRFCSERLEPFQVPQAVEIHLGPIAQMHGKKRRNPEL